MTVEESTIGMLVNVDISGKGMIHTLRKMYSRLNLAFLRSMISAKGGVKVATLTGMQFSSERLNQMGLLVTLLQFYITAFIVHPAIDTLKFHTTYSLLPCFLHSFLKVIADP